MCKSIWRVWSSHYGHFFAEHSVHIEITLVSHLTDLFSSKLAIFFFGSGAWGGGGGGGLELIKYERMVLSTALLDSSSVLLNL